MGSEFCAQKNVFGMAASDKIRAKFSKTFTDKLSILKISLWTADEIDRVEMDGKSPAVNGF
jgi:hypothetical protein